MYQHFWVLDPAASEVNISETDFRSFRCRAGNMVQLKILPLLWNQAKNSLGYKTTEKKELQQEHIHTQLKKKLKTISLIARVGENPVFCEKNRPSGFKKTFFFSGYLQNKLLKGWKYGMISKTGGLSFTVAIIKSMKLSCQKESVNILINYIHTQPVLVLLKGYFLLLV